MTQTIGADELGRTLNCKTPGCTGVAKSTRGIMAYCEQCRTRRRTEATPGDTFAERLKACQKLAAEVDRLRARATTLTRKALQAKQTADAKERELRERIAALSPERASIHG